MARAAALAGHGHLAALGRHGALDGEVAGRGRDGKRAVVALLAGRLTGPLTVVVTGPVNTSEENGGWTLPELFSQLATAAPVAVPVSVSVPDSGVAAAVALVPLLALVPDDEQAPAPPRRSRISAASARHRQGNAAAEWA